MTEAGIKPNLAKLTLARRIAATTLAMWEHQEDYDPSKARCQFAGPWGHPFAGSWGQGNGLNNRVGGCLEMASASTG